MVETSENSIDILSLPNAVFGIIICLSGTSGSFDNERFQSLLESIGFTKTNIDDALIGSQKGGLVKMVEEKVLLTEVGRDFAGRVRRFLSTV